MAIGFLIIFVLLNNIKSNYYEDKNNLDSISFNLQTDSSRISYGKNIRMV